MSSVSTIKGNAVKVILYLNVLMKNDPKHTYLHFYYQLNVILNITLVIFLPKKFLLLGQELSSDQDCEILIKMSENIGFRHVYRFVST